MLAPGTVIGGDYRIVSPLREGGMGAVYVAEQLSTGAQRALKVIQRDMMNDANLRKRFEQEARVTARIASDHVVQVVGAGIDPQTFTPWMAMELLRGRTLAEAVEQGGPMAPEQVIEIFTQLCHALTAAHAAGVVHRDLKPENLFLAESQRTSGSPYFVKVLDFGIARVRAEAKTARTIAVGTPLWMAPEQTSAGSNIGTWTDIWPLGLIAFWLLTGREYWRSTDSPDPTVSVMREILFDPLPPATQRARELGLGERFPPSFDAWFAQCVCREPQQRFQTPAAVREALAGALPATATLAATQLGDAARSPAVSPGATAPGAPAPAAWGGAAPVSGGAAPGAAPVSAARTAFGAPADFQAQAPQPAGQTAIGAPAGPASLGGAALPSSGAHVASSPAVAPPKSSSTGLVIGVAVGAIVLLGGGALAFKALGGAKAAQTCRATTEPTDKRVEACRSACAGAKGKGELCSLHGILLSRGGAPQLKEAAMVLGTACDGGDGLACERAALLAAFPPAGFQPVEPKRAAELATRACSADPRACAAMGVGAELGWFKDKQEPAALYEKACAAGSALGCGYGALLPKAPAGSKDRARAALEPECNGGDPFACALVGTLSADKVADAVAVLRKACDGGAGLACNNLGAMLAEGKGGDAPPDGVLALFEKACTSGEPAGCNNMGAMKSGLGVVTRHGPRGASVWKVRCAKAFNTGCSGWGKPLQPWPGGTPNLEEAVSGFDKACEGGLAAGCVNLGAFVVIGQGTAKDRARAHKLYQDACDRGDPGGCGESASLAIVGYAENPPDPAKGAQLMKRACDGGEKDACALFESMRLRGTGVPAEAPAAVQGLSELCDADIYMACAILGGAHYAGDGTPKNAAEARRIWEKSCPHGFGCADLAFAMYGGLGGPKEPDRAIEVLDRACKADRIEACFDLGVLYADVVKPRQAEKSAQLFKSACEIGHPASCNSLAIAHVKGDGVGKDESKGAQLAREACDDGYLAACATYGILLSSGIGEQKNVDKAKPLLSRACKGGVKSACTKLKDLGG